ncbi:MAG TPA: hypothetical protein VM537_36270 [Anaerolineae bacterium]|nr:hypothetical protein [Anaerolineae bacterium]
MKRTVTSLQAEIANLSLLRDHLEEELLEMRLQRSELQNENTRLRHQRDREHELGMRAAQNWHRVTMERDEARQWANRRMATVNALRCTNTRIRKVRNGNAALARQSQLECNDLRAQLAAAKGIQE